MLIWSIVDVDVNLTTVHWHLFVGVNLTPFGCVAPKGFWINWFSNQHTWWRLFQKHLV